MQFIKTLKESYLNIKLKNKGCKECQASCQSACKTSTTVANQSCENNLIKNDKFAK